MAANHRTPVKTAFLGQILVCTQLVWWLASFDEGFQLMLQFCLKCYDQESRSRLGSTPQLTEAHFGVWSIPTHFTAHSVWALMCACFCRLSCDRCTLSVSEPFSKLCIEVLCCKPESPFYVEFIKTGWCLQLTCHWGDVCLLYLNDLTWAGRWLRLKAPATTPDSLSSVPKTSMVEGEHWLAGCPLACICAPRYKYTQTHTTTTTNK